MSNKSCTLLIWMLVFMAAGCATPKLTQTSFDTYQIKTTDMRGIFGNYAEAKERTLKEAQEFAYSQNKVLMPISINERPMRPGVPYAIEYTFRLVNPQFANVGTSDSGDAGGDGSREDIACRGNGYAVGTNNYAICRQRIEANKVEAMQQQVATEKAKVQQDRDETVSGINSAIGSVFGGVIDFIFGAAVGLAATQGNSAVVPTANSNQPQRTTIQKPGGGFMHCETRGNDTFCF